jgi:hypothetical protein
MTSKNSHVAPSFGQSDIPQNDQNRCRNWVTNGIGHFNIKYLDRDLPKQEVQPLDKGPNVRLTFFE